MKTTDSNNSYPFLNGGGEMGHLTRTYDWSKTSLGTPDDWSLSLRTLLNMLLNSRFPMLIFWGPQLITFYNDAFRPSLGNNGKHPGSLGQRGEESWAESWPVIGPMIHSIMAGGEAVWFEDQKLPLYRDGQMGYAYWTYSFSPLIDDEGSVNGVLVTCSETTKAVENLAQLQQTNAQLAKAIEQNQVLHQEEQAAQRQLKASQQQLLTLFEQSPVAIAIISEDKLTFRRVNSFYAQLVGRHAEDLLDKPLLEALPELVGQGFDQLLRQVIQTGVAYVAKEVSVELIRQQGPETIYVDLAYQPYRQADERISGIFVVATDVTEQVRARRVIEQSEAHFRSLIEQAPIAICLFVGRQMTIELANQPMIELWGKGTTVLGKPLQDALPELRGQPFLAILDEVYTTGKAYAGKGMRADLVVAGQLQTFYYDFTYQPIRNAAGQVYAIMDMAIDVTKEVRLRQQVEQAQQALENAVDLAQLGIWKIDVTSQQADFSRQVTDWVGSSLPLTLSEAIGAIEPTDLPAFEAAFQGAHAVDSGGALDVEYRLKNTKTGELYLLHSKGQMRFDEKGNPVSLLGFTQDVTQIRATQLALESQVQERTQDLAATNEELTAANEELLATNEEFTQANHALEQAINDLKRSNENLEQFAYIASHDLQEPLRKIQAFSSLLEQQFGPELGDTGQDLLRRLALSGSRMSILIRDLLAFSRIATQQAKLSPVSLSRIIDESLETLSVLIEETNATIEISPLPTVRGDALQLGQLFLNLLANAIKFHKPGQSPQISVSARTVTARSLPAQLLQNMTCDQYCQISVSDEGIGFDEKYLDRIFQVFQRLHGKNEFAGTGVGLAICQKVVTNHSGLLTASSQPGQGATFTVYLPG